MKVTHPPLNPAPLPRWYRGADIPRRLIRRFARAVAERFQPDKIILFGSYAYGQPHADSDVDMLVIMPTRNELDQAVKICLVAFPLDELAKHRGEWVAWSPDGTRLAAASATPDALDDLIRAAGEDPEDCPIEGIPETDTVGGGLDAR